MPCLCPPSKWPVASCGVLCKCTVRYDTVRYILYSPALEVQMAQVGLAAHVSLFSLLSILFFYPFLNVLAHHHLGTRVLKVHINLGRYLRKHLGTLRLSPTSTDPWMHLGTGRPASSRRPTPSLRVLGPWAVGRGPWGHGHGTTATDTDTATITNSEMPCLVFVHT